MMRASSASYPALWSVSSASVCASLTLSLTLPGEMVSTGPPDSICLEACLPGEYSELVHLLAQEPGELLGGFAADEFDTLLAETIAQLRDGGRPNNLRVQTLDQLARRSRRRDQAVEGRVVEAREARLVDSRHIGQDGGPCAGGHREGAQLARADERERSGYLVESQHDVPAYQVDDGGCGSLVLDVQHPYARPAAEHRGRHVSRRTAPGRGARQFTRPALGERDQFL